MVNFLDEIVFDDFSNCLGLSQNECPKPNLKYTKIYKKDSTGYIDFIAEEEIIDYKNDINFSRSKRNTRRYKKVALVAKWIIFTRN
ncbi:MAG: hypothetical protein Ct9H90mP2_04600 [Dehalococcoidia bacterium]|nr:MAG: hypothetical protein Ct9H90mP2_04600 [Dehalococcoidia bacterium]